MFIDGSEIYGSLKDSCILPIIKQEFIKSQKTEMTAMYANTWLVGTHVMNKYYTIFDQSRGFREPHFGIALKDPDMDKNRQHHKDQEDQKKQEDQDKVNQYLVISVMALVFVGLILIVFCCIKAMKKKDEEDDSMQFEQMGGTPKIKPKVKDSSNSNRRSGLNYEINNS